MEQKQRIRTEIGKDHKINVQLKQEFGLLEILSLKLSQQDIYTSLCADYGVVCGRVTVNNGYGVPNARVSIFIPQLTEHEEDPVISALYPYKSYGDKTEEGFRYNLLPARRQHSGHAATGTFPDQNDILSREDILEVYENYYKYTVKTNDAGDFMIWGVPLGEQLIHVDLDVSDMGCFSLRPDDFIRKGFGIDDFKSAYEFKTSEDLDSLPQIITFDKGIEVYPFWGSEDLCEIGITRVDFDLSERGLKVEPSAMVIGGTFTDDGKNSINKNCKPRKNMSKKCSFVTNAGNIDAIRFSNNYDIHNLPVLEEYTVTDEINDDGSFAIRLPMNRDFLYTTEFGENDYTNDPNKGIPTSSCYRLRFTLTDEGLERVRARASYLVPNIREFEGDEDRSYAWSLQFSGYPQDAQGMILNNVDGDYYPQDYFYRFQYGKVYTVSSFQSMLFDSPKRMLGINDIVPSEDKDCSSSVVTFPTNMGIKNTSFNFQLLLSLVLAFLQFVFSSISLIAYEFIGSILKTISNVINIDIFGWKPFETLSEQILDAAFNVQAVGQIELPLTIYDTCDLCSNDDETVTQGFDPNAFCKIAELGIDVVGVTGATGYTYFILPTNVGATGINESTDPGTSIYNPSGGARDCDGNSECCGSYKISTSGYLAMNSLSTPNSYGTIYPRFYIYMGGHTGAPIGSTDFYITGTTVDFSRYPIGTYTVNATPITGFCFTDTQVKSLFGIESGSTYFQNNQITSGYYGYIIDREFPKIPVGSYTGITVEEGCEMYDTVYNEKHIKQSYLWISGTTKYENPELPDISQRLNNSITPGIEESTTKPTFGSEWSIGATVFYKPGQGRLPRYYEFSNISDQRYNRKTKTGYSEFRDGVFLIVPSIDGHCRQNAFALREWYRRKVIGLNFCGGVVNFAFIDNWLSGALYFFQFKAKIKDKKDGQKVKACQTVVRYSAEDERFYYRSCPYRYDLNPNAEVWGTDNEKGNLKYIAHPTTFVDLGPRDEFIKEICFDPSLDPNCSVSRSIGPTSFKTFGELVAFAVNYKMDVKDSDMQIRDFFKNDGFYAQSSNGFRGKIFNGDISQLISVNSEVGIDGFDLQNQKYAGYSISTLDPEAPGDIDVFQNFTGTYGPTPITLKYEDDGVRIRQCLNAPGFLTECSQKVPFYLWDKKGTGFGPHDITQLDDQCWDYSRIHTSFLQGMTYNYKWNQFIPNGLTDPDDPYLLPPMSYDFPGYLVTGITASAPGAEEFDVVVLTSDPNYSSDANTKQVYQSMNHGFTLLIATGGTIMDPTGGRLYIRLGEGGDWSNAFNVTSDWTPDRSYSIMASRDPYIDNKQILSTPFMFYFGLRPGKTGLDLLIQRFGPKGAFKPIE